MADIGGMVVDMLGRQARIIAKEAGGHRRCCLTITLQQSELAVSKGSYKQAPL